jgi:hypothetical protein
MSSWVEIGNLALRHLGEDRISALDQNSERARSVNDVHLSVRDIVLRKHPWNCALVRATAAPDAPGAETPPWGSAYQYSFPADPYCLRVWRLDPDHHGKAKWKSLRRKIHTDEGPVLYFEYIARIVDPEQYDANLAEAIAAEIALKIAFRLTESRSAEAAMKQWAASTLPVARTADAQEGTPEDPEESEFLEARR